MFSRWGVSRQLMALVMMFVVALMGFVAAYDHELSLTTIAGEQRAQQASSQLTNAYRILQQMTGIQTTVQQVLREKDPDNLDKLLADYKQRTADLGALIAAQNSAATDIQAGFSAWTTIAAAAMDQAMRGEAAEAQQRYMGELAPQFKKTSAASMTSAAPSRTIWPPISRSASGNQTGRAKSPTPPTLPLSAARDRCAK